MIVAAAYGVRDIIVKHAVDESVHSQWTLHPLSYIDGYGEI